MSTGGVFAARARAKARRVAARQAANALPVVGVDVRTSDLTRHVAACKALFLEIIRRAAYDYVLYRDSRNLEFRTHAREAYVWLFEETLDPPWSTVREKSGTADCAFLVICELLDLDPETVRRRVRVLTPRDVLMVGRLPLHRRAPREGADAVDATPLRDLFAAATEARHHGDPLGAASSPWRSRGS